MISIEIKKKILDIFKDSALEFKDSFDKNLKYNISSEENENELTLHFNIFYGKELNFDFIFKKQTNISEIISVIENDTKLGLDENPYLNIKPTDENLILANIFKKIHTDEVEEISCYKKFGIVIYNPFGLSGTYSINIKYLGD